VTLRAELLDALQALRIRDIPPDCLPLIEHARWVADWCLELEDPLVLAPSLSDALRHYLDRQLAPRIKPELAADPEFRELTALLLERDGLVGAAQYFVVR